MTKDLIFHMCREEEWLMAQKSGRYSGSSQDVADGFLHFSTSAQIRESASKHRAEQTDIVLLTVTPSLLGNALKWEPAREGKLFPHLYGDLCLEAVIRCDPLPLGPNGQHIFPEHVPDE
tara:strand:- start:3205 stop:3561 length:357 start_codon:yes stop_codon:yes gene_type:complete